MAKIGQNIGEIQAKHQAARAQNAETNQQTREGIKELA